MTHYLSLATLLSPAPLWGLSPIAVEALYSTPTPQTKSGYHEKRHLGSAKVQEEGAPLLPWESMGDRPNTYVNSFCQNRLALP